MEDLEEFGVTLDADIDGMVSSSTLQQIESLYTKNGFVILSNATEEEESITNCNHFLDENATSLRTTQPLLFTEQFDCLVRPKRWFRFVEHLLGGEQFPRFAEFTFRFVFFFLFLFLSLSLLPSPSLLSLFLRNISKRS